MTDPAPPRPLSQVLSAHALDLWGELRSRDQLDSEGAQAAIVVSLQRLLDDLKVDQQATTHTINSLRRLASNAIHTLARHAFRVSQGGMAKTICIECGQLRREHNADCRIGLVAEQAEEMRIAFRAG